MGEESGEVEEVIVEHVEIEQSTEPVEIKHCEQEEQVQNEKAELKDEITDSVSAETILMDDTNIKEETLNAEMDVNVAEEVSNDVINVSNEATTNTVDVEIPEAVEESTTEKRTSNEAHEDIGTREDEDTTTEEYSKKEE